MTAEEIKTVWKQAKEEQNVSFRQLEGKSGYAAQDLCRIFNVKHNTRLTQLIDVCDVLGLEVVVRKKPVTADGSDKLYLCDPKKKEGWNGFRLSFFSFDITIDQKVFSSV
jgi:hypothetical protein